MTAPPDHLGRAAGRARAGTLTSERADDRRGQRPVPAALAAPSASAPSRSGAVADSAVPTARSHVVAPADASSLVEASWADRITAHVALVEATLARELGELESAWDRNSFYDCAAYGSDLPRELRGLLDRGGKRTRPVMVFLGWVAAGAYDRPPAHDDRAHDDRAHDDRAHDDRAHDDRAHDMVRAAAAVEMLHCFALVHDDIMDESPTRRGHPTVHERAAQLHSRGNGIGASARFGDNIAVLVGDLAHSLADRLAASLTPALREVWHQMVMELLAGQAADVVGAATAVRRVDHARFVARQKTGYYTVSRPLQLGAVAAGADRRALAALADYGRHAGEAFALRDDILGVFGDPRLTGKPAGDDIRSGKPTVLLALATESVTGAAATALRRAGTPDMTEEDLRAVQDAMVEQGVVATVEAMIKDRVGDAVAALDPSALSVAGVSELTRVVDDLARRGR